MTKYQCQYCGHEFEVASYDYVYNPEPRCPICNDKTLKEIDLTKKDIFGYNEKKERKEYV